MAQKIVIEQKELEENKDKIKYCEALENGNILFFPSIPFEFPKEEIDFLLTQRQGGSASRKNIAYKPNQDKISNHDTKDPISAEKLKAILGGYSKRVSRFLSQILSPYSQGWKLDYASFRPFQEKGRQLRIRARNDLLHVDAFPTRPLHGARILRFFTNINPTESRQWVTSDGFEQLLQEFGEKISIPPSIGYDFKSKLVRKIKKLLHSAGFKIALRSPYDHFMLRMHNYMKENEEFQKTCRKDHWEFPPNSCWAVFTDQVSHAALAGQYALEQTLLVPPEVLLCPEKSPVAVLQRMSGKNLVDTEFLKEAFSR